MDIGIRHNFDTSVRHMPGAGYELMFQLTAISWGFVHMTHLEWARMLVHGARADKGGLKGWSFEASEDNGVFDFIFMTTTNIHHVCVKRSMLEEAAQASARDGKAHKLYHYYLPRLNKVSRP